MLTKLFGGSALAVALTLASTAAGALTTTSGTVYNFTNQYSASYGPQFMTDQSGLSTGYVDGVTDFDAFIGSAPTHVTSEGGGGVSYLTSGNSGPFIVDFDLGEAMSIERMALWNGTSGNNAAVQNFQVFTSNDSTFSTLTAVGSFVNPIGVSGAEPATVFDLTDSVARYLRLVLVDNYGNGCCIGIGEVVFDAAAVPLPASLPLMIFGIAAVGYVSRRRTPEV